MSSKDSLQGGGLPLAGCRVIERSRTVAAAYAGRLLASMGATVVMVEPPEGSPLRAEPPMLDGTGHNALFAFLASGKHSVVCDLLSPEGLRILDRELENADILIGLGFDALRAVKPDIILLSLSSSGQSGPDSHFAGYAPLFGAWGGLGTMTGYTDGPPVEMRHVMDHSAGAHAAVATVAALHQRRRTGRAQHIDLAAREVASAMIGDALVQASVGVTPVRPGNRHLSMAPHGVYPTQQPDRWLTLAIRSDAEWQALVRELDQAAASGDPRFATAEGRLRYRDELDALLTQWLSVRNADSAAEQLQRAGVCAHVSWSMQDIARDPHLRERGATVEVSAPDVPPRLAVGAPARFSRTHDVGIRRLTPTLGEDEDYVFGELLGLSSAQRADLERREVIL